MQQKLWTKDFTTITLGSVVSMLGNSISGFAMSLFVLDYQDSTLLYAIYIFLYTLPQIAAPVISGPLMDRFSRRRTIYTLDFCSAVLYSSLGIMILLDAFNFGIFATATFLIGCINSIYMVAFESFYPMLITEGNYSKAYSISGTLQTMTAFILPLATVAYKAFGLAPLLIVNSAFFLLAAAFETRISDVEAISKSPAASYSTKAYFTDMKDGVKYLVSEKGLLFVTLYFMVISLVGGCSQVITLPWFKGSFENGEYLYMFVSLFSVAGRSIGGFIHYLVKLPAAKKFSIALFVYVTIALIEAFYLYVPIVPMVIGSFLIGILGVTSYNIRVSATQSYVPNNIKGRFNGAFFMLNTVGTLTGELLSGLLAEFIPMRATLTVFMLFSAVSALVIIGGNKKHIAPIYNRNV
ncbi:MAG: MFS transporter [Oscillospiraceae bacterium]|nr:MFS transporter [Oscillospiraceae bacterium]